MTTLTIFVTVGTDDITENTNTNTTTTTDTTLNPALKDAGVGHFQYCAFRYVNVTIPNSATITSADVSFWFNNASNTGSFTVFGNAADNPAGLSSSTDIDTLATTTHSTSWSPGSLTANQYTAIPTDMSSTFNEITTRAGWVSGNAMVFLTQGTGTTGSSSIISTYDNSPSKAPAINVTYTSTSPPATPTGLAAETAGPTSTQLNWVTATGSPTDDLIRYSTDNATWTTVDLHDGGAGTLTDIVGLTAGTLYYFQIAASNAGGQSAWGPSPPVEWITGDDGSILMDQWGFNDAGSAFVANEMGPPGHIASF